VICRGTDQTGGLILAERLRARVESRPVLIYETPLAITITVGLAVGPSVHIPNPMSHLMAALAATLVAKTAGRNRVLAR
jgi:PleD family two-component response regulator